MTRLDTGNNQKVIANVHSMQNNGLRVKSQPQEESVELAITE